MSDGSVIGGKQANTVKGSGMLSPFSSALAKLDGSLQTIQNQLERRRADLDVNEDQLRRTLADACHYATILSQLIVDRRSTANQDDHTALDQLIHELTALRRTQRRRLKLLNLAAELNAGRVRHHRFKRTQELNVLRLHAVKELWEAATSNASERDLPGPRSSKWLQWACALQEETDAQALDSLRRDFPVLEEFVAAMDEHYWASGNTAPTEFSTVIAEGSDDEYLDGSAPSFEQIGKASTDTDRLARDLLARFERVLYSGGAEAPSQATRNEVMAVSQSPAGDAVVDKKTRPPAPGDGLPLQPRSGLAKERIDKASGIEFMKVVKAWDLDDSEARRLLGISRSLFNQLRAGERIPLEPDKLTRVSLLVAIAKGLNVLYGKRRGVKWVHQPNSNPLFDGGEPLNYMLKEGVDGLVKVRQLVGVWSGYVAPGEQG